MGNIELYLNYAVFFGGAVIGLVVGAIVVRSTANDYRKIHPVAFILMIAFLGFLIERGTTSANSMAFTTLLALTVYGGIGVVVRIILLERFLRWWQRRNSDYE